MTEYIERNAADKALTISAANDKDKNRRTWAKAICVLHDLPAADVAPVVHGRWIPVSERLPKPETEVMIVCNRNGRRFIATAIHEDGTLFEGDSSWRWNDIEEYSCYDEERDDYIIPEGWWESRYFTPDDVYNCPVDCEVTHWMPMPEMPKMVQEVSK